MLIDCTHCQARVNAEILKQAERLIHENHSRNPQQSSHVPHSRIRLNLEQALRSYNR